MSGSSDGDVTFWDGTHGVSLSSFRQHKADVLAIAASPDGTSVFASGIDSQIAVFEKLDGALGEEGANRWLELMDSARPVIKRVLNPR